MPEGTLCEALAYKINIIFRVLFNIISPDKYAAAYTDMV